MTLILGSREAIEGSWRREITINEVKEGSWRQWVRREEPINPDAPKRIIFILLMNMGSGTKSGCLTIS
jgi:hypothetical protein